MSIHTYQRSSISGFFDLTDTVANDVAAALPSHRFLVHMDPDSARFEFDSDLIPAEVDALGAAVEAHRSDGAVAFARRIRYQEIDARTNELILAGYEFPPGSGLVFSASEDMQRTLIALYMSRNHPAISYPITWSTGDDQDQLDLVDADAIEGFYLTGLGHIRACKDSGTALKQQIKNAPSLAAVAAVADTR